MKLTKKELLILEQIISGHIYGLDIVKSSDGQIKRGTVYVLLNRMEERGLVTSERKDPKSYIRSYTVTGEGHRACQAYQYIFEMFEGKLSTP